MGFKGKLSKYFFSNGITYFFLVILIKIFILKTTAYHKYIPKIHTKKCKKTLLSSMFNFALNIGDISAQSHMLLFVICFSPATLIWLLHCNAMHFDSFSLGARHLFQKLVLGIFFCEVILVIHCCFQN
jgi:hypothetical protein